MQDKNRAITINAVYKHFVDTGRFDALKCKWKEGAENKPHFFWDSDVAKWLEGASYIINKHKSHELSSKIEAAIDDFQSNQWEDGYINSYYTVTDHEKRFKLRCNHELYCAGHLMEAAVVHFKATNSKRFLNMIDKYADLIYKVFVKDHTADFITPGHEEIELALLKMYRCTGMKKYLEMCGYFLNNRGKSKETMSDTDGIAKESYDQHNLPIYELEQAEGHAVRAMYLYTAMADYAYETGNTELLTTCRRLFFDVTEKKMYISGGIGSTYIGEAFTVPYDLPSETAYAETCASIGLLFFADRMLKNEINSVYADVIERVLYNGILSGLSHDGKAFFYENPLEISLRNQRRNTSTTSKDRLPLTTRREVFECSCCPPNLNRVIASIEQYIYSEKEGTYYVNQFMESIFYDGAKSIKQETNYPNDGKVLLHFTGIERAAIRIPYWCDNLEINSEYTIKNGYAYIDNPDEISINFNMKPMLYCANAEVDDCSNKVALMYGPVLYCAEGVDNNVNQHRLYISEKLNAEISPLPELDTLSITVDGFKRNTDNGLYSVFCEHFVKKRIKLIPYRLFANRGESDMLVWLNYKL